jgi:hypothetical protein
MVRYDARGLEMRQAPMFSQVLFVRIFFLEYFDSSDQIQDEFIGGLVHDTVLGKSHRFYCWHFNSGELA